METVIIRCQSPTCGTRITDPTQTLCTCCKAPLGAWDYALWAMNKHFEAERKREEEKKDA